MVDGFYKKAMHLRVALCVIAVYIGCFAQGMFQSEMNCGMNIAQFFDEDCYQYKLNVTLDDYKGKEVTIEVSSKECDFLEEYKLHSPNIILPKACSTKTINDGCTYNIKRLDSNCTKPFLSECAQIDMDYLWENNSIIFTWTLGPNEILNNATFKHIINDKEEILDVNISEFLGTSSVNFTKNYTQISSQNATTSIINGKFQINKHCLTSKNLEINNQLNCGLILKEFFDESCSEIKLNLTLGSKAESGYILLNPENFESCQGSANHYLMTTKTRIIPDNCGKLFKSGCSYNITIGNCKVRHKSADSKKQDFCTNLNPSINMTYKWLNEEEKDLMVNWTLGPGQYLTDLTLKYGNNVDFPHKILHNISTMSEFINKSSGYFTDKVNKSLFSVNNTLEVYGSFVINKHCDITHALHINQPILSGSTHLYSFVVIFILTAAIGYVFYKKKKKRPSRRCILEVNTIYTPFIENPHEIPPESVDILDKLDDGCFGVVYRAKIKDLHGISGWTVVAAKMLKEAATIEASDEFRKEKETMARIADHPNIVKFYGSCNVRSYGYTLFMEFVPYGSLHSYLRRLREEWTRSQSLDSVFTGSDSSYIHIRDGNLKPSVTTQMTNLSDDSTPLNTQFALDHNDLQSFALQIARGMAHLESIPVIHRDLAARNVLIGENKVMKISDFGMSKLDLLYYNKTPRRLPLRWMSIEAILEHRTNSKSDVWSFGVVLWEIGTLAGYPYEFVQNDGVIHHLLGGNRLERPEICTDELYEVMMKCWLKEPSERPNFAQIVDILSGRNRAYVDFSELDRNYVFPPMETLN